MTNLPLKRVVLYKHGIGFFEREGTIEGNTTIEVPFKQADVSDVLKSLTVLDLDGGTISTVSYDSTKPLEQLLAEIAFHIPDAKSLHQFIPQIKGARVAIKTENSAEPVVGTILGIDELETLGNPGTAKKPIISLLTDDATIHSFSLFGGALQLLDDGLRRDLEFYLRTQLSAKKKDARTIRLAAAGTGTRRIRMSYVLEAPVWKATYRLLLPATEEAAPLIQGWAVVDNMQESDWENVALTLVAGLPVSFIHDLYTPRYIRRPVVAVKETTGVLPPEVEGGMLSDTALAMPASPTAFGEISRASRKQRSALAASISSVETQVRERQVGDLFEYAIDHPVTIRRNESALVPIVLKPFRGRSVLYYQKAAHSGNPMRCIEFENTTGLTLEGGPVTVLEGESYVGEAMLETMKPDEKRLIPYSVELSVKVMDSIDSRKQWLSRLILRNGSLITFTTCVQRTVYTLISMSEREAILFIDDPRHGPEWVLHGDNQPVEITDHYWRFRITLPGKQTSSFVVEQHTLLQRVQNIGELDFANPHVWLHEQHLNAETQKIVQQIASERQRLAGFESQLEQLRLERERIFAEQTRIRENLNALTDLSSEKELRERYVRSLNVHEDRLEAIGIEDRETRQNIENIRMRLAEIIGKLDYEASFGN